MRKDLRGFRIEVVREALRELGYKGGTFHLGFPSEYDEWRKGGIHVVVKEKKGGLSFHIYRDPAFHIGKVRTKGRDLELEVKLILKQMKQPLQHCGKVGCKVDTPGQLPFITFGWFRAELSPIASGRIKQPIPYKIEATASKPYNRQKILECLAKKFAQFCASTPIKDTNRFQITENEAEMGFFSMSPLHRILDCYVLYNIIYTKDSRILECSRMFCNFLHIDSRMFCRWSYA